MPTHDLPHRGDNQGFVTYELPGGWHVLVGKTAEDNDYLSLKVAQPQDWWFHVRGMPGSHVVLRAQPHIAPDREILRQTAAIAAYHSKARRGGVVAVSCTQARYVTKPQRVPPGTVRIRKEQVFKVRPGIGLLEGLWSNVTESFPET